MASTTLLMLPGMDGDGRLFDRFRRVVAERSTLEVVVVSLNPAALASYDAVAAVVRSRCAALGPVVLVGESYCGPVVARLCADPPPNLQAGVMVASFPRSPVPGPPELLRPAARLALLHPPPALFVRLVLTGLDADAALVAAVQSAIASAPADLLLARLDAIFEVDVRPRLAECQVPLLHIRATRDRLVSRRRAAEISTCCPTARVVALEGPHLLLQTRPRQVHQAIASFIEGLQHA